MASVVGMSASCESQWPAATGFAGVTAASNPGRCSSQWCKPTSLPFQNNDIEADQWEGSKGYSSPVVQSVQRQSAG
jgi:hypothetical protein